jgi:hypothetical protein
MSKSGKLKQIADKMLFLFVYLVNPAYSQRKALVPVRVKRNAK